MYGRDMSAGAAREKTEEAEAAGVLGSDRLKNLLDEMGKSFWGRHFPLVRQKKSFPGLKRSEPLTT